MLFPFFAFMIFDFIDNCQKEVFKLEKFLRSFGYVL